MRICLSRFFLCPVCSGVKWGEYFLISLEYSGIYFINNCNEVIASTESSWKYARERKHWGWRGTMYDQKDSGDQMG